MDIRRLPALPTLLLCVGLGLSPSAHALKWRSVSCSAYGSAAITTKGDLYVTGSHVNGELGDNQTGLLPLYRSRWTKVAGKIDSIILDTDHSLAINAKNQLLATGNNDYGQLGLGTQKSRKQWKKALADVTAAAVGYKSSLAIKQDGSLWVTGISNLGNRNYIASFYGLRWRKMPDGVKSAAAGSYKAYAVNQQDELLRITYPFGSTPPPAPPQWEKLEEGVSQVISYPGSLVNEVVIQKLDGSAWWAYELGTLSFRQIAMGTERIKGSQQGLLLLDPSGSLSILKYPTTESSTEIQTDVTDFCAGAQHALVVKHDGTLWASGINNQGQFGIKNGSGTSSLQEWIQVKFK